MTVLMIPNIIYAAKNKNVVQNYRNKAVIFLEQLGRYGCFILMIFNIPYTYFDFWFDNALVYLSVNGALCLAYIAFWIILRNDNGKLKALSLSVLPSCIFLFSGIMLLNIPLIVFASIFAVNHILISCKNAAKPKKLSEMTLEELWRLFPIYLTEHNSAWAQQYLDEVSVLKSILPPTTVFHHVGSTAIEAIKAKPIVDILIAVDSPDNMREAAKLLENNGYIVMSASDKRISLNKGYTEQGFAEKVFHLHIRLKDDVDEIYFRDYLNAHIDVAREYEALKLRLWKAYPNNRDAYTEGKTEFVTKYTAIAKRNSL